MARVVGSEPRLRLEYLSIASTCDGSELESVPGAHGGPPTLVSIAASVGSTRLIDNLLL